MGLEERSTAVIPQVKMATDIIKREEVPEISPRTGKPKRRKAIRACIHCQRTHLTCDNNRPCERCVSRGLGDTCRDGTRKKAKYLGNDDPQKSQRQPVQPPTQTQPQRPPAPPQPQVTQIPPPPAQQPVPAMANGQLMNLNGNLDANLGNVAVHPAIATPMAPNPPVSEFYPRFQSAATDSEYNILSSILHVDKSDSSPFSENSHDGHYPLDTAGVTDYTLENFNLNDVLALDQDNSPINDWLQPPVRPPPISLTINQAWQSPEHKANPLHVYQSVVAPFPYTPGFHALFSYIKTRFNKAQLMEIVRSMAKYRPSFIAYASSLTQEDLVFLEQCFQRSLLEYERYFAFSGTPAIIWRRTGQIAAVGPEFCMLTGYSMNELLPSDHKDPGKFIVELMDDQSAVNYFNTFSEIAFGDHRGVRMSNCTLVTKMGKPVRTSSVLTLKRDMFGIPMLIIGNFLPVLQK